MADYRRIKIMGHDLMICDTNQMLEDNCRFLLEWRIEQEYLHENDQETEDLLVVSHHAPLIKECCDPRYLPIDRKTGQIDRMKWVNYCFATDLGNLIQFLAPQAWIFGHTHYRTAFDYHGTVVASNPVGRLKGGQQLGQEVVQVL
jgi:Icc-related predicted phosphoesterase